MTNIELMSRVSSDYEADRKRLLETARPCDIYEIYVKYEIVCWLESIIEDNDKYCVEICDGLKELNEPLDFMFEAYRDCDEGTRDRVMGAVFDALQWRKDYGED